MLSHVRLLVTPWTIARHALLSHGILQAGFLPDPEIELGSPALQVDSLLFESPGKPLNK